MSDTVSIAREASGTYRLSLGWIIALVAILFVIQAIFLWDFGIDDVGISYRFALHLAEGHGLVWNVDGTKVEGYSNLLWVLFLAASKWLGGDIELTSKVLGALSGVLSLTLLSLLCHRLWYPRVLWWFPALLVAVTPEWTAWAMSGLEIASFSAFLLLALLGLSERGGRRGLLLSVSLPGLILTRPEGAIMAGALLLFAIMTGRENPLWERLKAHTIPITTCAASIFGLLMFRLAYFGYPLPNTVYAKFSGDLPALPQVIDWLIFAAPFLLAWAIVLTVSRTSRYAGLLAATITLVILQILIVLPVNPVMYMFHRYQIPFLPLLVLPVPWVAEKLMRGRTWPRLVVAGILLIWSAQGWPTILKRLDAELYSMDRQRCVAENLKTLPGNPTVAMIDAGRTAYWAEVNALDAWGLCDLTLARTGFSPEVILSRLPDAYVMSVDPVGPNRLKPRIGLDMLMMQQDDFRRQYTHWVLCAGGSPLYVWHYDYAIFVNIAWAKKNHLTGLIDVDYERLPDSSDP